MSRKRTPEGELKPHGFVHVPRDMWLEILVHYLTPVRKDTFYFALVCSDWKQLYEATDRLRFRLFLGERRAGYIERGCTISMVYFLLHALEIRAITSWRFYDLRAGYDMVEFQNSKQEARVEYPLLQTRSQFIDQVVTHFDKTERHGFSLVFVAFGGSSLAKIQEDTNIEPAGLEILSWISSKSDSLSPGSYCFDLGMAFQFIQETPRAEDYLYHIVVDTRKGLKNLW